MAAIVSVGEENFAAEVLESPKVVLIDFWAPWCAPCRMVAPIVEELAEEMEEKLKVVKVNVDENIALAERYGIRSIPTLLLLKGGEVKQSIIGYRPKQEVEGIVKGVVGA
jgi:thioredoxin 1